jgi:hypothetical protein
VTMLMENQWVQGQGKDSDIDGEEYDGLDGVPLGGYGVRAGAGVSAVDAARQSSSGERGGAYDDYDDDVDGVPLDAPVVSNARNSSISISVNAGHVPGKRRRNSEDDSRIKTKSNRKEKDRSKSEKYASDSSDSDGDKGPGRIDFL